MQDLRIILGSSGPLPFLMIDQADHRTGLTGLTPTVQLSRNAGAFGAPAGTVGEIGNGWYQLAAAGDDTGHTGPLILHAEAAGADPVDVRYEVVPASGVAPLAVNAGRYPLTFLLIDAADHVTGKSGLSPAVTLIKTGGAPEAPAGSVGEIGLGWYYVAGNAADTDTPGALLLHATAAGADDTDERYQVLGTDLTGRIDRLTLTLLAVKALLVNSGLFTANNCVVTLEREPFTTPAPPCCYITPGPYSFDQGLNTGGGRYETVIDFNFTVRVVVRRARDIEGQDVHFLTDASLGGYPIVTAVVNALTEQFLYSLAGDQLTVTGLKPRNVQSPARYGKDPMMGVVAIDFSTQVQMDLELPDPTSA